MSKFTWRIENFSKLDVEKIHSHSFFVNGNNWRVSLYPKGNGTDHISVYLEVQDSSSADWSVPTKFRVSLVNQIDCNETIAMESEHTFNSHESYWGWAEFVPLGEFHDEVEGFLVEDTCVIEAEVYFSSLSSDEVIQFDIACHWLSLFSDF
ncbi:hypothetical protein DM860_000276 [Cuscuta australis]|uniref:MATH domain-containing protein n=1 Tax=Cuscuta australis TaxID=267555 RepID=A0A328CW30_9ASTE|nr:hypothetical protein DM860_000276 [Cuscuta australis]